MRAFSLTSRQCCSAAAGQWFSQIHLTVRDNKKLDDDLKLRSQVLSRGGHFRGVRRIKILRSKHHIPDGVVPEESLHDSVSDQDDDNYKNGDDIRDYFDMLDFCKPSWITIDSARSSTFGNNGSYIKTWQPITHFMSHLGGLQDFVWAYGTDVPGYVLTAVHAVSCRLHVHWFNLRSLIEHRDHGLDADSKELALATSPCLYSIVVPFNDGIWGKFGYNQEAVLRMVAGTAAKLTHVWIYWRLSAYPVPTEPFRITNPV